MAAKGGGLVRTVLQQCLQARLQVQEADEQQEAQYVQEEFMCLGILFTNEGKMESYIDRRIGAVSAVKQVLYQSVMEKRELDLQINRGMVIYICFFKGATDDILPKMVNTLLNLRLCELPSGKRVSVLELPGSLLIVPQATLGGKAKGKGMQYHNNISKEDGVKLYSSFISLCEKELMAAGREAEVTVRHGTYGQRQVLQLDTNGPYTHLMDF